MKIRRSMCVCVFVCVSVTHKKITNENDYRRQQYGTVNAYNIRYTRIYSA